jgi:N-acetylglucosaminyldiphosphoundecaprenol N-acetyl-beta-D-mannosaminyltransferase
MMMFGISIEGMSKEEVVERFRTAITPLWVVTANPEILLAAHWDSNYKKALQQADIRVVDGVGLFGFGRLFGQTWARATGVELGEALLKEAHTQDLRVAFIGGKKRVAELAAAHWRTVYPSLSLIAERGGMVQSDGTDDEEGEEARHRLTLFAPQIVLVGFGHPKQERWIARYLQDMPSVKMIVGVGGTFDYWAGNIRRAPKVFQALGMEWVWRLVQEPKRIGRIFKAVVVFPVLALIDRLR